MKDHIDRQTHQLIQHLSIPRSSQNEDKEEKNRNIPNVDAHISLPNGQIHFESYEGVPQGRGLRNMKPKGSHLFSEAARKEAREWFKNLSRASLKDPCPPPKLYTPLNSPRGEILNY